MRKIESLDELHHILLDIAKSFHQICVDEGIPYFMAAGTLLGAARHSGFIPWDDDMDFIVPRADFSNLKSILNQKLPSHYKVMGREEGIVVSGIYKIVDVRTEQDYRWSTNHKVHFGVNIDIFPLDYSKTAWKRIAIQKLRVLQGLKGLDASVRPFPKNLIAYLTKGLLSFTEDDILQNIIDTKLIETDGPFLINHYGAYGNREVMPKELFDHKVLMSFEDTQFYGMERFDEYLRIMYGNYMQIPPVEKRHTHLSNIYWKQ